MALTSDDLKAHLNITADPLDEVDAVVLPRLLAAATKHVERLLGYALTDTVELPGGTPADLEQAVLMVAAHWYENREGTITGTIVAPLPIGVAEIIAEHRSYTFG